MENAEITERSIFAFWNWFRLQVSLLEKSDASDDIRDELLAELQSIDPGLYYEISTTQAPCEFVVTAEGKKKLFDLVDLTVGLAPAVPGWRYVALKPPLGFSFKSQYQGMAVNPQQMWFLPLLSESDPALLGLRIGVPEYSEKHEHDIKNAVLTILDTALGEREIAEGVVRVEVVPLPFRPEDEGYIELPQLGKYLQWRKQRDRG